MKDSEILAIVLSIIIFAIVISFEDLLNQNFFALGTGLLFSTIIILVNISAKKIAAHKLDAEVSSEIWSFQRFGFKPKDHFKKKIWIGIFLPLLVSIISLGLVKFSALMTYETSALKRRAARRHGFYSFTEMTDSHISLIGASGIIAVLLLSFIAYFIPGSANLSALAAYYAFWNMFPISKLDGAQIFFGSRLLWTALAVITIVFTGYALLLV